MAEFGTFDWVFLIWLCAFGVITILFLFYFNRVLSSILSALLSAYTWNFYGVAVDIQAIQVSPLGGRIFVKGVRYHGENETILIHDGFITWRYWYRRVRHSEATKNQPSRRRDSIQSNDGSPASISENEAEPAREEQEQNRPCRIMAELRGVEWFVYNRKPAYDSVLSTLLKPPKTPSDLSNDSGETTKDSKGQDSSTNDEKAQHSDAQNGAADLNKGLAKEYSSKASGNDSSSNPTSGSRAHPERSEPDQAGSEHQLPVFLNIFPIAIRCLNAAMVMGNEHTRSILVAKADSIDGIIEAKPSKPQDQYRQSFEFDLFDTTVQFKQNQDYTEPQLQTGARLKHETQAAPSARYSGAQPWGFGGHWTRLFATIQTLNPFHSASKTSLAEPVTRKRGDSTTAKMHVVDASDNRWLGLSRYLKDDIDGHLEHERWKAIEYARFETIVDCPKIGMNFYWDVPGLVPFSRNRVSGSSGLGQDINGDIAPAYGLEVSVFGGSINYGPWADRQRANLQSVFFPSSYTTTDPAKPLRSGQSRVSTVFKILITLEEEVTLRLHTREESKDWRWKDHLQKSETPTNKTKQKSKKGEQSAVDSTFRPDGWMDLKVSTDTSVTYCMAMFPSQNGYHNTLEMDIKPAHMTSSVNHDLMWRCKGGSLSCTMPNPLTWNVLREWHFDISLDEFELFIIRDHAFLLTDLVNDWTTGPPGEFFTFVPIMYSLGLSLPNFKIYLNCNDSNIIDSPASLEDNAFVVICGESLNADIGIPIKYFRPLKNEVTFDVTASQGSLRLITPIWSTQRTFLSDDRMGSFGEVVVHGSYNYCTSTSNTLTDTVLLDVYGSSASVHLYGFLIRYFLNFKDNYFGEDLHFQTQDEYQQHINTEAENKLPASEEKSRLKITNDLDVILTVTAEESSILIPSNLYSASENIKIDIISTSADLRFTNYYMDLQVDFSPLALTAGSIDLVDGLNASSDSNTQAFIDGASIAGHRLFGLPPTEPTYVCNWDFSVGSVIGECTLDFVSNALRAARCFAFSFVDFENALPKRNPLILHDITFLRASVKPIKVWLHVGSSAFLLDSDSITVTFNDWAGERFSERLHVSLPKVMVACMDGRSVARSRAKSSAKGSTYAYVKSSVDVRMVETKAHFRDERKLQQEHITIHDSRTHRTPWLLDEEAPLVLPLPKPLPPVSPFPPMPEPLVNSQVPSLRDASSMTSRSNGSLQGRKASSFLSHNSTGTSSRKRPRDRSSAKTRGSSEAHATVISPSDTEKDRKESRRGLAPTSMAFSSAFQTPYFPLQFVTPDTADVPICEVENSSDDDKPDSSELLIPEQDEAMCHTAVMIRLEDGVQALCTPEALFHINTLVANLQASSPGAILDQLHASSLSEAVSNSKPLATPKSLELSLTLPAVALRLQNRASTDDSYLERRVYDLNVRNLVATIRTRPKVHKATALDNADIVSHLLLDKVVCTASGINHPSSEDQARIELLLDQTVIWLTRDQALKGDLQFRDLRLTNSNRNIEQLASLINGTLALGDSLASSFQNTAAVQENRLRSLVYFLATSPRTLPDPAFLTSTSYALRTTSYNPRNEDTWKLMSRLRHISNQTSMDDQSVLITQCTSTEKRHPHDARSKVTASFNRWRSWDLANVDNSSLMKAAFGPAMHSSEGVPLGPALPIDFCLRGGSIGIVIDPGPKKNVFEIQNMVVALNSAVSGPPKTTQPASLRQDWLVEVSIVDVGLQLNWGICELLESVLQQYLAAPSITSVATSVTRKDSRSSVSYNWSLQAALAVEAISTTFETINFRAFSEFIELASSAVIILDENGDLLATVVANSTELRSGFAGHHQPVIRCALTQPTVNGAVQFHEEGISYRTWKAGGLCRKIEVDIKEDALGLLGIADLFLRDEMAYVRHIDEDILGRLRTLPGQPKSRVQSLPTSNKFHVSLLLLEYTVAVKLLSSLTYQIHGNIARSSFRTHDTSTHRFSFDFDVDDSRHSLTNLNNTQELKVLEITLPPLNGQLLPVKDKSNLHVTAALAVQELTIHASDIHALFTTLSRREVSAFKDNVVRDVSSVKSNWEAIAWRQTDNSSSVTAPEDIRTVTYSAKVSAVGLSIKASSSSSSNLAAELQFSVGRFSANLSNVGDHETVLTYPEIKATLNRVAVILMRADSSGSQPCGDLSFTASFTGTSRPNHEGKLARAFIIATDDLEINAFPSTASSVVDILGYLQQRFKSFNLSDEINTFRTRRSRAKSHATPKVGSVDNSRVNSDQPSSLFSSMYSLDMNYIQVCWHVGDMNSVSPTREVEDLVFSIAKIDLATRKANSARLALKDLQLQMVPQSRSKRARSQNSALLPEVVFNVAYLSTSKDRRLAFQAAGRTLDLRLTSQFILPAAALQTSIAIATEELRKVVADWNAAFVREEQQNKTLLGNKTLSSVLVDVDFAGAEVRIQGAKKETSLSSRLAKSSQEKAGSEDSEKSLVMSAPGIAFKVEYVNIAEAHSLSAEVKVSASSNTLHPTVVPLILEMSESVKAIVGDKNNTDSLEEEQSPTRASKQEPLASTNPAAILGNCRLNIGLRICKQDFSLTCQPIARVAATARFEDIYVTINTVEATDKHRFFALSAVITSLGSSVQHVYSRDKTGSFALDSINLSLMNSRHVSDTEGLSAILKFSPMKIDINAKQLHDFFLFREIWLPVDLRQSATTPPTPNPMESSQIFGVQRYQQMATASAFPWNASVSIESLDVKVDLGQALGKTSFSIADFWIASKKSSDYQQSLCVGFQKVAVTSSGRMSGFIELRKFHLQTSIYFPSKTTNQTPLIEASLGIDDLRVKAAFEYQAFLIADFSSLEFLMYNVRDTASGTDRLVCSVDGDKVHLYFTTHSASQAVGLHYAIQRLVEDKRAAYKQSLKDVAAFLRRTSVANQEQSSPALHGAPLEADDENKTPIKLQTNVMVALKALKIGAYPTTFFDNQIFKLEALDANATFSVALRDGQLESGLGMELGQVRIALSNTNIKTDKQSLEDLSVEEVVSYSAGSRGGTVLKVPRVVATMRTFQKLESTHIEYVFKSAFEGKVEVGWNYSRISYIRGMWEKHSRTLAHRLGKPLTQSAVQITGGPRPDPDGKSPDSAATEKEQEKITAVVNVPLSKYTYTAIEPPVIVTPQLRDMGDATPPLEWIGLHRDRLPNVTHQIILVPLLEVAKEVEDAYSKILGAS